MIHFQQVDTQTFLKEYWQKKPLLIKQALPSFISPLEPEELAGLSLEPEIESRIVIQKGEQNYELITGPFDEDIYQSLPEKNWTLLVQGGDRIVPEVTALLDEFNFIPQWRVDDIMISYATEGGNVGPHFDHYDVFLLQGKGKRTWHLTSQNCTLDNYLPNTPLRLMEKYVVEERFVCEPGDLLYIPPKWGHHGIGETDDCMTYSIGYRSYRGQELWDSYGDYLSENSLFQSLYHDPDWSNLKSSAEVTASSAQQAKALLEQALQKNPIDLQLWFGRFATQLDQAAIPLLPEPLEEAEIPSDAEFEAFLAESPTIMRDPVCRFAFADIETEQGLETVLFVNGSVEPTREATTQCIHTLASQRFYEDNTLYQLWQTPANRPLIRHFWQQQYLQIQA